MKYVYLSPIGNKPNLIPLNHIVRVQPHRRGEGCLLFLTNRHEPLEITDNIEVVQSAMEEE